MSDIISKKPLLSIITPVYNREDCIAHCIQSVCPQVKDGDVEHIIVDDGSKDATFDIAQRLATRYNHIRAYRLDKNRGTNAARNFAVQHANGRFIMLLDSDDALAENAVEVIRRQLEQHADVKHFMFAVDDRLEYYRACGIDEDDCRTFTFADFLLGNIQGDFAHVILKETMSKYPFEEKLRVFEGVVFLSFYKEAGKVLFKNHTAINRDRSRSDRVTNILIPDNKASLRRHVTALQLTFTNFGAEFKATEKGRRILADKLHKYYKFSTLLGDAEAVAIATSQLRGLGIAPSKAFNVINDLHCGPLAFQCVRMLMKLKYLFKKVE